LGLMLRKNACTVVEGEERTMPDVVLAAVAINFMITWPSKYTCLQGRYHHWHPKYKNSNKLDICNAYALGPRSPHRPSRWVISISSAARASRIELTHHTDPIHSCCASRRRWITGSATSRAPSAPLMGSLVIDQPISLGNTVHER
jgi:hypothetical protein